MGPRRLAVGPEVVGVGGALRCPIMCRLHRVRDALALRVSLSQFQRLERQLHLRPGIRGRGIAHQRVDLARRRLLEYQDPLLGLALARLHGVGGGAVDACGGHDVPLG